MCALFTLLKRNFLLKNVIFPSNNRNLWRAIHESRYLITANVPNPLVQDLQAKYNHHSELINGIMTKNPHLESTGNISQWNNCIETLKNFGFRESDCFNIISVDPQILAIPNNELSAVLSRWHQCEIGGEFFKLLVLNNPSFLHVPCNFIDKRIPILQNFTNKPKTLVLLLLQCPNVFTENWEQVQAKIDYMLNVMRVDKSEILQSKALNKPLKHIKVRHQILLKCGLFEAPSQYEHKRVKNEKSAFRNPPLKRIMDNEDISFARKICKISHEEYEMFREAFEDFEDESVGDSEDELISDSDSDSDSERVRK